MKSRMMNHGSERRKVGRDGAGVFFTLTPLPTWYGHERPRRRRKPSVEGRAGPWEASGVHRCYVAFSVAGKEGVTTTPQPNSEVHSVVLRCGTLAEHAALAVLVVVIPHRCEVLGGGRVRVGHAHQPPLEPHVHADDAAQRDRHAGVCMPLASVPNAGGPERVPGTFRTVAIYRSRQLRPRPRVSRQNASPVQATPLRGTDESLTMKVLPRRNALTLGSCELRPRTSTGGAPCTCLPPV